MFLAEQALKPPTFQEPRRLHYDATGVAEATTGAENAPWLRPTDGRKERPLPSKAQPGQRHFGSTTPGSEVTTVCLRLSLWLENFKPNSTLLTFFIYSQKNLVLSN